MVRCVRARAKILTRVGGSTSIGVSCGVLVVPRARQEGDAMSWEAPDFVEVKMDAEINSYQDDFGGEQDDRF